jgi:hypothetical protein
MGVGAEGSIQGKGIRTPTNPMATVQMMVVVVAAAVMR